MRRLELHLTDSDIASFGVAANERLVESFKAVPFLNREDLDVIEDSLLRHADEVASAMVGVADEVALAMLGCERA